MECARLVPGVAWPTDLAGGGVIAIVELGGGWVQSDMDQFFAGINQPVPQITGISVDGTQNSPNQHLGDPNVLFQTVSGFAAFGLCGRIVPPQPMTVRGGLPFEGDIPYSSWGEPYLKGS